MNDKYNYDSIVFPTSYDDIKMFEEERKLYIIRHGLELDSDVELKKLELWEKYNDPKKDAITSKVWYKYYELKDSVKNDEKNLSEGFKYIKQHNLYKQY